MSRRGQGQGSLFPWKRKNPETGELEQIGWCAMADLGYIGGKRRRQALYGKTQREVVDRLNETLRDHQRGVLPKAGRTTLEQWLTTWLGSVEGSIRPRTLEHYRWIVREHLIPSLGRTPLAKLAPSDVETMLSAKLKPGPGHLAPRTVHHVRAVLRNALQTAERDGLVSRNVASLARAPKVPKTEMKTLLPDQVETYLEAVDGQPLEALFVVALGVGLRQGEVLGLRWQDLELERRDESGAPAPALHVRWALQWQRNGTDGGHPALVEPKSESSRRTVRIPGFVAEALRDHRRRWLAEKLRLGPRWLDEWDLVFVGPYGEPLNPRTVLMEHHAALRRAGLPRIRFHDLRHSCASLLGARGVPARVIQAILGHSSISLTLGTYSHVFAEQHDNAAAAMDRILGR